MDAKETGRVQPVKVMNFPHTFVIILAMIVVALILTWVVPAGMYDFIKTPSGQKVVDPATFRYIKSTGINPVLIPLYIIKSFSKRIDLMMVIFMAGSAFHVVTKTGALQAILAKGAKRFSNRLEVFIPVLTLIFGLICTTQGVNTFIPFAPVMVMLAMAMGLDSITGEAIMVLGGAIGFFHGDVQHVYDRGGAKHCRAADLFRSLVSCCLLCRLLYRDQYLFDPVCQENQKESGKEPDVRFGPADER